ncbi:aldehyde dehydrogenase family protein [Rhodococcus sp. NPDC019627]|uniref:aldehyde dehydrogenase family protein n=1 Tax=unclassified Rhodococcus (in: high G+C Gram-positive bacteria) TaxID=192944 RepID=UPI0033CCCCD3
MTVTRAAESNSAATRPEITLPVTKLLIAGQRTDASDGRTRDVFDPSSGAVVTSVPEATADDVRAAIGAARSAFDEGAWATLNCRDRGRILLRAAVLLRDRAEQFARLESTDTGKPITFSRMVDVATAADMFEYYGSLALGIEGATRTTGVPTFAYTLREPIGVVAAITPFNFPLILSLSKIAPALAAGNTVVHKPAEDTPLTALAIGELLIEAGLPDGVFNVVTGGAEAGSVLVEDPRVDKIAFTGSTAVGTTIATRAAATLKHVTVELGGKSANLIFADADIESAVQAAISGFVYNTGQFCMAGTRLLVERPIYEDVVTAVGAGAGYVPVGDPFADSTVIGPMTGPKHLAKVTGFLDRAAAADVRVLGGGAVSGVDGAGWYQAPTVLADVTQDSEFVQEEIFGPVLTVQPFDSEDEAVALANSTRYGLAAGLQTTDIGRAHRVAARLNAGLVWVNNWGVLDVQMPIGGYKQSGYGRENGPEGLDEYLQTKSVIVAT